jgi:hypothetical protein
MNKRHLKTALIPIAMLIAHASIAGSITELTIFTADTPAKASEVNANFTAVKAAVDDSNARLREAESAKQNRINGNCAVGSVITAIAADGTVTCVPQSPDSRFGVNTTSASAGSGELCTIGRIILVAGGLAGATPAAGQILSIVDYEVAFAVLGTTYGGDGQTTFALPDLRSAAPNGLTYVICLAGIFPARI